MLAGLSFRLACYLERLLEQGPPRVGIEEEHIG
jgi:hypothetical protein